MALVDHSLYGSQQTFHGDLSYALHNASMAFASGQSSDIYGMKSAFQPDAPAPCPKRTTCHSEPYLRTDAASEDIFSMEFDNTSNNAHYLSATLSRFDADVPLKTNRKQIRKGLRLALGHVQNLISRLEARELDLRSFSSFDDDDFLSKSKSDMKQTQDDHHGLVEDKVEGIKRASLSDLDSPKLKRSKRESEVNKLSAIMQQCSAILKKLRNHKHSWVFNEPVDFVALEIPDYPMIITHPMDLGTIERKLDNHEYESPAAFAADVRLTFANAMEYNPKGHEVHSMAVSLLKFFEERWKMIGKKFKHINMENRVASNIKFVPVHCHESNAYTKASRTILPTGAQDDKEVCMRPTTFEEKQSFSLMLENSQMDKLDQVMSIIRRKNPDVKSVDRLGALEIDSLDPDCLWELHDLLNQSATSKSDHQKFTVSLCDGDKRPCCARKQLTFNDQITPWKADSDVLNEEAKLGDCGQSTIGSLTDEVSLSIQACVSGETSQKADVDLTPSQISERSLRAALLKNRFADTILKAREKTLTYSQKNGIDPEIARRKKEELEKIQREEKARLQAEAKVAENARKRAETEAVAKARLEREAERQAVRLLLQEMERTASVDENDDFMKHLEMLGTASVAECQSAHSQDGLGSFAFDYGNPLEKLGLFMKLDDEEEDIAGIIVEEAPVKGKQLNLDQNEDGELDD